MTTDRHCRLAGLAILGLICIIWHAGPVAAQASPEPTQMILHMLDYVAVDYPESVQDGAVLDQAEYGEQLEFVHQAQTMLTQLPAHVDKPRLLRQAEELVKLVEDKRPGPDVAFQAQQLRWNIIRAYQVEVAPKRPPDLRSAASLYQTQCMGCHGLQGYGDGPAAASLEPRPSNFHDRQRLDQRSIYGRYSTITLGVQGTAMASFRSLKEDERWALAFYVSSLADTEAERTHGAELWQSGVGRAWFPDLASVATATATNVKAQHGDDALRLLALLRSRPEVIAPSHESPLARSARLLRESLETYRSGQPQAAQELAVSAYLDGFEPVEASLDTVDRPLRMAVESEMLRYRTMLKNGEPI